MAKIATRSAKPTAVLAYEQFPEYGHCRSVDTVTVEAGMDVGAVVQLDTGKYVWVAAADVATLADDVRIVIDIDITEKAAGDHSLVTLGMPAGGAAGVARGGLKFKDALTSGQVNTVVAALAAKGIKTLTTV
jgi:hypothetical protein